MRFRFYNDLILLNGSSWDRYFPARSDPLIDYDVIVIGSGMGGGILADATSDAGLKTLVLEAGPIKHLVNVTDLPVPNAVESVEPYEVTGSGVLRGGVSFNLGGRSIFWSAVIPRMRQWELRYWPAKVGDYLRSDEGYARAESLFRKRTLYPKFQDELKENVGEKFPDYDVTHLPRSLHQPDSEINPRPGSPDERSSGVFSTAALLSNSLTNAFTRPPKTGPDKAGADNLHVALQHIVDTIETDGRSAKAVHAIDVRSGCTRKFKGKNVVLAAGCTESPRIAIASQLSDKSGLLGVGLTDHQEAKLEFSIPEGSEIFTPNDQGNLYLLPKDTGSSDLFSCELALNYKFWDVRIEDDELWLQTFSDPDQATRSTIKFLFHNPLSDSNRLTVDGDRYRISIEKMTADPLRSEAEELTAQILAYLEVTDKEPRLDYSSDSVTSDLAGSMRMGEQRSVVDTDLRLREYNNIFCCDLSVFPDIPASNPSLTLGALAQRLAERLAQGPDW